MKKQKKKKRSNEKEESMERKCSDVFICHQHYILRFLRQMMIYICIYMDAKKVLLKVTERNVLLLLNHITHRN